MTVEIRRYDKTCEKDWNLFVESSKNPLFMFNRNYMDYHSDRFQDHSLMFYKGESLIAIMPCSEHNNELRSHGGLTYGGIISDINMRQNIMQECLQELKRYCKEQTIHSVLYKSVPAIYHTQPAEEDIFSLFYAGGTLAKIEASTVINLQNPIKMSKLRKRQISKAIKSNIKIEMDNNEQTFHSFMELQDSVLLKQHNVHAVHTGKEIYLLHTNFPENIHLYVAKRDNKIIAGTIVYKYRTVAHTQYLCANDEARRIGALDAVISLVIESCSDTKRWLDFGISTEDNGHFLNEGLINQKEGFGGRTCVYNTWLLSIE